MSNNKKYTYLPTHVPLHGKLYPMHSCMTLWQPCEKVSVVYACSYKCIVIVFSGLQSDWVMLGFDYIKVHYTLCPVYCSCPFFLQEAS